MSVLQTEFVKLQASNRTRLGILLMPLLLLCFHIHYGSALVELQLN